MSRKVASRGILTVAPAVVLAGLALSAALAQGPAEVTIASLSPGTAWYVYGAAIGDLLRPALPANSKIEVLPLSNFDNQIRRAVFRAIYRQPGLDRLAFQAVPPIHIIVKNGNVTLEGVVPNKGDATRAFIAANGVSNVFSVTNNLRVEKGE